MGCVEDVYRVCLRILWDVYVWSIGVKYIYLTPTGKVTCYFRWDNGVSTRMRNDAI